MPSSCRSSSHREDDRDRRGRRPERAGLGQADLGDLARTPTSVTTMNRHGWVLLLLPVQRATSAIASSSARSTGSSVNSRIWRVRRRGRSRSAGVSVIAPILLRVNRSVDGGSTTLPPGSGRTSDVAGPARADPWPMNVIEVTNLTKRYGDQTAVDDVSFSVEAGEIFAHPRPERRRQDHHRRVDQRAPDARRRRHRVLGLDPRRDRDELRERPRRPAPGERAARQAHGPARRSTCTRRSTGSRPTRRSCIDGLGLAEKRDTAVPEALGRPEAAALDRARPRRQPAGRDPRRADDRASTRRPAATRGSSSRASATAA